MAAYLVHYVAKDADRDYGGLSAVFRRTKAVQLTEGLWLIESEFSLRDVTKILFMDRPLSDRFFIVEVSAESAWSAANLFNDPRETFLALRFGRGSVKIYTRGQPPRRVDDKRNGR